VPDASSALFKPIHRAKAEVATWLAWQRMPGKPVASCVGDRLVALTASPCRRLGEWLDAVFP